MICSFRLEARWVSFTMNQSSSTLVVLFLVIIMVSISTGFSTALFSYLSIYSFLD